MASPLVNVPWDDCLLKPHRHRELENLAQRRMGLVPPAVPYLTGCPWLVRTLINWHPDYGMLSHLDLELADLVAMVVSQENACRYCYAATRAMLRLRGFSDHRVEQLESQIAAGDLDDRTLTAIRYAGKLSRAAPLPDRSDRAELLAGGFSSEEHRELAFVVAYTELANRVHTITAVPPKSLERLASGWVPALLRLTAARRIVSLRRRGRASESIPRGEVPYADLLRQFAGTPIGPALSETLQDVSHSTILPRKPRALIFAVIAHALDCRISAAEARNMLPRDVAQDDFAAVLAHLGGSAAEPLEREVASFARDTIWYSPLAVQRRARALQRQLSDQAFLEVVGLACLANAMCRLAAAVSQA